jgi:hypothetical protein
MRVLAGCSALATAFDLAQAEEPSHNRPVEWRHWETNEPSSNDGRRARPILAGVAIFLFAGEGDQMLRVGSWRE